MATFQCAFNDFFSALPFPKKLVNANVLTSITSKSSVPDLRISLQSIADYDVSVIVTGVGETAFTQGIMPMYHKLRTAVEVYPSLLLAVAAAVDEISPYHTPRAGSPAWNTLLFEPTIRSQKDFLAGAGTGSTPALNRPMIIEGHTWSSIARVRMKAWIRLGDVDVDGHIDMDTTDPNEVAEGVSFFPAKFQVVSNLLFEDILPDE
jgi:hypothetical protein